jgi:hypothetical protein
MRLLTHSRPRGATAARSLTTSPQAPLGF